MQVSLERIPSAATLLYSCFSLLYHSCCSNYQSHSQMNGYYRYCNKQFDFGEEVSPDELCPSAPNKMRETLDRACCVVCYKGAW